MPHRRIIVALSATTAATACAAVLAAAPHAQTAPTTLTITETGKPAIAMDDLAPKGMRKGRFSLGDRLVLRQQVTTDAGKGTLIGVATIDDPGSVPANKATGMISARYRLPGGDLFVEGSTTFAGSGSGTGAVVGGTGAYAGARGTLTSSGDHDTITLISG